MVDDNVTHGSINDEARDSDVGCSGSAFSCWVGDEEKETPFGNTRDINCTSECRLVAAASDYERCESERLPEGLGQVEAWKYFRVEDTHKRFTDYRIDSILK